MRWRLPREQFERQKGEANRNALRLGVESGRITGIIGYAKEQPVAWCSVGPRADLVGLAASEILARVDDQPVWAVGCFFVHRRYRRQGMTEQLLLAAVDFARARGATIVEGYPLVPIKEKIPVAFAWTGFESAFRAAGFQEVARRVPIRPIVRFDLRNTAAPEQASR